MTELSESDEWETPPELFKRLSDQYDMNFTLDVATNDDYNNSLCDESLTRAFDQEWLTDGDIWCNPPHSQNREFVVRANDQWKKHNINILMLLPSRATHSRYAQKYIKPYAEVHPIYGRIRFLRDGKLSENTSLNAYDVVIWRKT